MVSNVDSSALLQHLIAQTRSNVSFLISQNQISPSTGQQILDKLPPSGPSIPDPVTALSNQASNIHISNSPTSYNSRDYNPSPAPNGSPPVKAKALWGYNESGEDFEDLSFEAGDIIEIVQETNPDWWTGRHKGREGLFPSNYVEKLPPRSTPSKRAPPPPVPNARAGTSRSPSSYRPLGTPVAPQPSYPQSYPPPGGPPPPGAYGPPPTGYYQPPPPPMGGYGSYGPPPGPVPVMVSASAPPAPIADDPPKKSRFGGMGNTLATAAVGGLGFGAGSAVGSDVVNSIF
ncbi:hypothetical protein GYMLUDRAFT_42056 [Collybiopsis luxurians FD-317 M1]|uniref:SH3 domain-containing protein n=1 Tax=Collybiopsis luxurians FD-317 M1 TaxID=944289 RepID=A0A0D0BFH0_9AGAR|nr:hypothetical protein GYMLUDRAFT_42056 [Collybiopsis luxurians FD-317 M1]